MSAAKRQSAQGFVLITVVVMLTVLAAIALMVVNTTNIEVASDAQLNSSTALNYGAEAGLEHAIWSLNQHAGCTDYENLSASTLGKSLYEATISPDSGSPVSIESIAKLSNGATRILHRDNVTVYNQADVKTLVINVSAEIKDTFIEAKNNHEFHNQGSATVLRMGAEPSKEDRTLMQFDLSRLPPGVRIESASLELEVTWWADTEEIEVHRLVRDWTEAGVTWETYDGINSWDSVGGGGDYDPLSIGSFFTDGPGVKSVDLTAVISGWANGTLVNHGVILSALNSDAGQPNYFSSSDAPGSDYPRLTINYSCECGMPCGLYGFGKEPVAHWLMDDGSGLEALDAVGGHSGTLDNGPYWTDSGQIDQALQFDGLNDRVSVPHDDALSVVDSLTISAWVRNDSPDMAGTYRILSKESDGSTDNFWLSVQAGRMWFGVGSQSFTDGSMLTTGQWHHVAATFDTSSGEVHMYFDGIETLSQTTLTTITANSDPLYLGANWEDSKHWNGALDDIRLYDTVLTEAEIVGVGATAALNNGVLVTDIYRDEFKLRDYSGDDGSLSWATDWLEINESDGPTSGDEQVLSDGDIDYVLRVQYHQLTSGEGVQREADLSACSTSTLSLDYRRSSIIKPVSSVFVAVSSDAGFSWTNLVELNGPADDLLYQHFAYDISAFMSATTRLRLFSSKKLKATERVYFDNVNISCD